MIAMRNIKEIPVHDGAHDRACAWPAAQVDALAAELDTNGIVVLPSLLDAEQLISKDINRPNAIVTWSKMFCCSSRGL